MLGMKNDQAILCDHDAVWDDVAGNTIGFLRLFFGAIAVDVQHIGSTAIPAIKAKPIIDIVIGVSDMDEVRPLVPVLAVGGFHHRPEYDAPDYMMFVVGNVDTGLHTHNIHVMPHDGEEWRDRLAFRDYMNAHPETAQEYEALKARLLHYHAGNHASYTSGKRRYIESVLERALAWQAG